MRVEIPYLFMKKMINKLIWHVTNERENTLPFFASNEKEINPYMIEVFSNQKYTFNYYLENQNI
jgi:hypothetical protein